MKIVTQGPRWAVIDASEEEVRRALSDPHTPDTHLTKPYTEHLLKGGAKVYPRNDGMWMVSGYTDHDVPHALALMQGKHS